MEVGLIFELGVGEIIYLFPDLPAPRPELPQFAPDFPNPHSNPHLHPANLPQPILQPPIFFPQSRYPFLPFFVFLFLFLLLFFLLCDWPA